MPLFDITTQREDLLNHKADLVILDSDNFETYHEEIRTFKDDIAPGYLPLLIQLKGDLNNLPPHLWKIAEDLLQVPVPKKILKTRINQLVKTRKFSRKLEMYYNVIEAATTGMVITDPKLPDNPIIFCNNAFQELTGYKRHEVIGRNCRFLQG